tara:strand:+ start:869 stop:1192 length:324 start_codon:yes stop_codon:yes gene_type:complete
MSFSRLDPRLQREPVEVQAKKIRSPRPGNTSTNGRAKKTLREIAEDVIALRREQDIVHVTSDALLLSRYPDSVKLIRYSAERGMSRLSMIKIWGLSLVDAAIGRPQA